MPPKPEGPDYKARLEKKLLLARETPEPVFDLSDCNLKKIPLDIFSLCKVFRKQALHLEKNHLTSLQGGGHLHDLKNLILLNLSNNNFSKLPNDIDALENLQVLNVSNNQLIELPNSIGNLRMLAVLNLSNNKLETLPETIGNCTSLEELDVSNNEPLKRLPVNLGKLANLAKLYVDPTIIFPPGDVCKSGVKEILKFLRKELGTMEAPSTSTKSTTQNYKYDKIHDTVEFDDPGGYLSQSQTDMDDEAQMAPERRFPIYDLGEKIRQQEEFKANKQKEFLSFEKSLAEQKEEELKLQEQSKQQKAKVLNNIKENEKSLNKELAKVQEKKSQERAALIKQCQEEEEKSNEVVNRILKLNKSTKLDAPALWEMERKNEEAFLLSYAKANRAMNKKEILDGMEAIMHNEIKKARNAATEKREKVLDSLISGIIAQEEEVQNLLKKRDLDSAHLMEAIRKNENLQKMAVTSLLEKTDAASWQLAKEIAMVEAHLAELTKLELKKKKLQSDSQIAELNENRLALTRLLIELFEKQTQRRNFLIDMMKKMEQLRESYTGSNTFWLDQYNKLYDSKSYQMVKFLEEVDQKLVYELFLNDVFQYLPLLKDVATNQKYLEKLDRDTLTELGVDNSADKNKILESVQSFLKYRKSQISQPSAPSLAVPSSPLDLTSYTVPEECVVCLDKKPEIVFIPCGHICCCYKCFGLISLCPLCRRSVDKVFDVLKVA